MTEPRSGELTLATAGHVDHGKTALVEALTGTNTDRLEEERRRGISIELGFARLELGEGRSVGLVDVPGHHRLVRAMVAGCSGIDAFVLAIAADDGVMPQTREHLRVLRSLGVEPGVIALTKCDAAPAESRAIAREDAAELAPDLAIVEVSARTGEGIDALRESIARLTSTIEPSGFAAWPPRRTVLHLDRVFTLKGIGTIVTGTLRGGSLTAGATVLTLPSEREVRIRSIQVHGEIVPEVRSGQRAALNLVGIGRDELRRGDVILGGGGPPPPTSYRLDVDLDFEPGAMGSSTRVQVHHGTRAVPARLITLADGRLAQLRLSSPLIAGSADRLVIRSIAPPGTLGGGIVIDPAPPRHGPGEATRALRLAIEGAPEAILPAAVERSPAGLAEAPSSWLEAPLLGHALRRFSEEGWGRAAGALVEAGTLALDGGRLRSPSQPQQSIESAPVALGVNEVRVLRELSAAGVQPPGPSALAAALAIPPQEVDRSLELLVRAGRLVRLGGDVLYPTATLERLRATTVELARERGSISLAELRDALRISRRYSQAILERLDADGVTIRHGERHVLRRPAG